MKKKFLLLGFALACLCLCFGLAACGETPEEQGTPTEPTYYKVTVAEGSGYTVKGLNADGYKEGDAVAFTVEITDETKQIQEVSADSKALTAEQDGSYKFTMPAKDVAVSVVLKLKTPELALSETSLTLNAKTGDTASVTATVTPNSDVYELEWKSANENIATVTVDGKTAEITAVAKGATVITVSFKGLEGVAPSTIEVSVINARPWTETEETAMKEHLYGIVLYPTEYDDMLAAWDASEGLIAVEGGEVEGTGLAEYAAQYVTDDNWVDVSYMYGDDVSDAYMFEQAIETADGTRYVRVFIYATEDASGDYLAQEGFFFILAYDPYVYEWPAAYLQAALKDVLSKTAIPSVTAQHYYVSSYGVTAYYESDEEDGGYGAILEAADYTVTKEDGYYKAVSPDELFCLVYAYENGALEISIRYITSDSWPAAAIANAFVYYAEAGTTAFELPVFEGDDVSFMFADGIYNKFWINEGKAKDMYGTVTVSDSTSALTEAYLQKLADNGWTAMGTDGTYIKPIADSNQVNKIKVSFSEDKETTEITVYYFSVKDPSKGWNDNTIKENIFFYKYKTDSLPEYTGEITAFSADKDTVYLTVPEEDFADLLDNYKQILIDAGFTLEGATTWPQMYVSPNRQYGLKPSVRSSVPNTIQIYFSSEMPCEWNNERIKASMQYIGSSVESIPQFESETSFLCGYEFKNNYSTTPTTQYLRLTISASASGETISQADFDAYKAKLVADEGWTQDSANSNKFSASDGTTIELSYSSGSITIDVKYVAAA